MERSDEREIFSRVQTAFIRGKGLFLGLFNKVPIWDKSANHALIINPGKSSGFIIPSILAHTGPLIIHDATGELWEKTAEHRQAAGQRVIRYSLQGDDVTDAYNPLDRIRVGTPWEVVDAQNLAKLIEDPHGLGYNTGSDSDVWRRTTYGFLVGLILHVLHDGNIPTSKKNLTGLSALLSNPLKSQVKMLHEMLNCEHDPEGKHNWIDYDEKPTKTHPVVAQAARSLLDRPDGERGSILASVKSRLDIYNEPKLARLTETSTFNMHDILSDTKPVSLYIVGNPLDGSGQPLVHVLLAHALTEAITVNGEQQKVRNNDLLLVLDAIGSSAVSGILSTCLPTFAEYGIRLLMNFGSIAELFDTFSKKDAILANVSILAFCKTLDAKTADFASKLDPTVLKTTTLFQIDSDAAFIFTPNNKVVRVRVPGDWIESISELGNLDDCIDGYQDQDKESLASRYHDPARGNELGVQTPYGNLHAVAYSPAGKFLNMDTITFEGLLNINGNAYIAGLTCVREKHSGWKVLRYEDAPIPSPFDLRISLANGAAAAKVLDRNVIVERSSELLGKVFTVACKELREALMCPDGLTWHQLDHERFQKKSA